MSNISVQEAWQKIFDKYNVVQEVNNNGYFEIKANQIKEFKEPRLMAKWDSSESLPSIFKKNKINILPVSRGSYIMSDFRLYKGIPELLEKETEMQKVEVPEYESIDTKNITSEANAINVLLLSNILDDFLNEDNNVSTFNGRMGTGKFQFYVDRHRGVPLNVRVDRAQCEIDGGFENSNSVVILEAKNIVYPDFHVRQLYYPYRLWKNKVNKPIRLVFSIYSNQIYRLFEYTFEDYKNYSSIKLVKEKNYSLQNTKISIEDLYDIYIKTIVIYDDDQAKTNIPFIQADSFERIISLIEILAIKPRTTQEIADLMQFELRQSDYYFNAGRYLGLFEKVTSKKRGNVIVVKLTAQGKLVYLSNYKKRQLMLVELMLRHRIFKQLFFKTYVDGVLPGREDIKEMMRDYNVCNEGQVDRRARTVLAWLKWIFNLPNI